MGIRHVIARTRRFAHLIVSSADEADNYVFDVIEKEKDYLGPGMDDDTVRQKLYRSLCDRLADHEDERVTLDGSHSLPVIQRFYDLPKINRMAFALIVIEEFSSDAAADILRLPHKSLEEKILQSRQLLFEV